MSWTPHHAGTQGRERRGNRKKQKPSDVKLGPGYSRASGRRVSAVATQPELSMRGAPPMPPLSSAAQEEKREPRTPAPPTLPYGQTNAEQQMAFAGLPSPGKDRAPAQLPRHRPMEDVADELCWRVWRGANLAVNAVRTARSGCCGGAWGEQTADDHVLRQIDSCTGQQQRRRNTIPGPAYVYLQPGRIRLLVRHRSFGRARELRLRCLLLAIYTVLRRPHSCRGLGRARVHLPHTHTHTRTCTRSP